ncbi:MAG: hypothetical protein KAJ06_06595, partial [Gammaproteobacteria bacterium]|nr:hypothetical protein [Gammaproteobacteria bacterium]
MPAQNATNTTNWTQVDIDGFRGTTTINLTNGFRDRVYYTTSMVYDRTSSSDLNNCGTAPCMEKNGGSVVTMRVTGHGLAVGDWISVQEWQLNSSDCDNDWEVEPTRIISVSGDTFTFDSTNNGTDGNDKACDVVKIDYASAAKRNGIAGSTTNPFEYRKAPTENPLNHGYPYTAGNYNFGGNYNTNAFYYTIIPTEYCSDETLTACVASTVPTVGYTYPAPARWCNSELNSNANAPVSDSAKCRGKYKTSAGAFRYPRFGKLYRKDIVPATASYQNIFVNSAGTVLESGNASEAGYTIVVDRTNGRTDCATVGSCTYAEEMTNFSNWYTYYRIRTQAMKTSAGRAFAEFPGDNIRIGYARLNQGSRTIDGKTSLGSMRLGVRTFTGTAKEDWFDDFYATDASGGTPLRRALDDVGQYYSRTDNRGPWGTYPEDSSTSEISSAAASCRQSYTVLSSDGYWSTGSTREARHDDRKANVDNTPGPAISTPTSWSNAVELPYSDVYSNTLADVAMYYWKNDLRTNLDNTVVISTKDDAFWQHMVTFTLGFGLEGTLDPDTDLPALTAGTTTSAGSIGWPSASSNQIDDMWHAAVNGRGQFFSADDPAELVTSIRGVFSDITDRTSSAASVAIDTAVTTTARDIYQARFFSGDWTGTVKSFPLNLDTGAIGAENWDAQTQVSAQDPDTGRFIATWDLTASPNDGTPFRWADLTTAQQTALNLDRLGVADGRGSERVDFTRGSDVTGFRPRTGGVLGDIVHTAPIYVAAPPRSYSGSYQSFKTANTSRTPMIYVAANDGMMHAFEAATGDEKFAYIPNTVIGELSKLTSSAYVHQYYVDGPITVEDIQDSGGNWKTALVGTLGSGGKAVYALDVTDPVLTGATNVLKEADLASKVLWEFT